MRINRLISALITPLALASLGCESSVDPTRTRLSTEAFEECQSRFIFGDCVTIDPDLYERLVQVDRYCALYDAVADASPLADPAMFGPDEIEQAGIEPGIAWNEETSDACAEISAEFFRCTWTGVTDERGQLRGNSYSPNPDGTCGLQHRIDFVRRRGFSVPQLPDEPPSPDHARRCM